MALSREDFWREAQRSAAHEFGKNHAGAINAWRMAPVAGVLALIGALGWAGHWAWIHASADHAGDGPALPGWSLLAFVSLLLITIIAYRPGRIPSFSPLRFVKHGAVLIAWLGLIAFTLGTLH